MDLFDLDRFFEMDVPVKASTYPLLLYGAVALSAKFLGRLDRRARRLREGVPPYSSSQWLHIAREYYDRTIGLLRQALEIKTRPLSAHGRQGSQRPQSSSSMGEILPETESDELVGTTAILCVYEFIDGSASEWSQHLDGAKSLFDIAKDSIMAVSVQPHGHQVPMTVLQPASSKSRTAVFWNIARQDMLNACQYMHN